MKLSRRSALGLLALTGALPDMGFAAAGGEEAGDFVGPLAGWLDLKRDFGAVGDGKADDTAALQAGLSAATSRPATLYIPAGSYRITSTVTLKQAQGVAVYGEDPATTRLIWDGPAGGTMVACDIWYSAMGRLSLLGGRKAGVGIRYAPHFVTANRMSDLYFRDMAVGAQAGAPDVAGVAETLFERCRFIRCSRAGLSVENFNSLDLWCWDCFFEDCALGVTNNLHNGGAGNFHVYRSQFRNSTIADISIRNTGFFGFRDNLSIGSKAFFVGEWITASAQLTFQRNTIVQARDEIAIRIGNVGPVILLDNNFISRVRHPGPVVAAPNASLLSAGNRYTSGEFCTAKPGGISLQDTRATLTAPPPPPPAPAPRRFRGRIVEIQPGGAPGVLQAAIDSCRPGEACAIHLASGAHSLDRTLTIPAGLDLRLVGDGILQRTSLNWAGGPGPMLKVAAATAFHLQHLRLAADPATDVMVVEGDPAGGIVSVDQVQVTQLAAEGYAFSRLSNTEVVLRNIDHNGCGVGMRVTGLGAGRESPRVTVLNGSSSNNDISYALDDAARLLLVDIWYESSTKPGFMRLTGAAEFTFNGGTVATPRRAGSPPVAISGLKGRVALVNVCFPSPDEQNPAVAVNQTAGSEVLLLGSHGSGEYLGVTGSQGKTVRTQSVQYTPGGGARTIGDVGAYTPAWLLSMIAPLRSRVSQRAVEPPRPGSRHVQLTRVLIQGGRRGLVVQP